MNPSLSRTLVNKKNSPLSYESQTGSLRKEED